MDESATLHFRLLGNHEALQNKLNILLVCVFTF